MPAPLQPSLLPVVFGKLDTKTAPRLAQQGTLLEMVNSQMTQGGRIQKRPGYTSLGKNAGMAAGRGLVSYNGELVALASSKVWGYSPQTTLWTQKGEMSDVQPSVENVVSNSGSQTEPSVAVGDGFACYAWKDANGISYSLHDLSTGQAVLYNQPVLSASVVQVVFMNHTFCLVFTLANVLTIRQFSSASPWTLGGAVSSGITVATNQLDAKAYAAVGKVAVAVNVGGSLTTVFYDPASSTFSSATTTAGVGVVTNGAFGWLEDDARDFRCYLGVYCPSGITVVTFDFNNVAVTAESIISVGVPAQAAQITGFIDRTTTPVTKNVFWHQNDVSGSGSDTYNDRIGAGTFQTGTGAASNQAVLRGVGIASKAWLVNGVPYLIATYDGRNVATAAANVQQTYFVINPLTGVVYAKFLATTGAGMRQQCSLSSVGQTGASAWVAAVVRKVQVATELGLTQLVKSVSRVYLNFAETARSTPRSLAQGLYLPGGTVRRYDGGGSPELGFHLYPEAPLVTFNAGGALAVGTYQYVVVYAEFDRYGVLHRSQPSLPFQIGIGAGTGNFTIKFNYYRVTSKSNVIVEIYRRDVTTGTDTVNFYKVTSVATPIANNPAADTSTFNDNTSTIEKETHEILYTAGGVYGNDGPPPARVMTVHRDRIVLGGLDIANRLLPSKPVLPDQGLAFSNNFIMATDPTDGETTALASMDDKLIDFHANAIYFYTGDGPSVIGQGGYSAPVRLPGFTGTTEPESVVVTDRGVLFSSSNDGGTYLLGRDLTVSYVGADVEGFNGADVTAALVVPVLNQTRLFSGSGTTQVRDEYFQRWYTWTNQPAAGACVFNGLATWIAPDGTVYQETPGVYGDNGEPIQMRLTLAPISPFAPGGWGRLWALQLIGDYRDPHKVRVRFKLDHADWFAEELLIDAGATVASDIYGANTYGVGTWGGTSAGDYRFEIRPRQQRFSAVGITIEDVISDGSLAAGLDLSAIGLLVGAQPGALAKIPIGRMMVSQ